MVQISGNYKLERDENYIEFLEAVGMYVNLIKLISKPRTTAIIFYAL